MSRCSRKRSKGGGGVMHGDGWVMRGGGWVMRGDGWVMRGDGWVMHGGGPYRRPRGGVLETGFNGHSRMVSREGERGRSRGQESLRSLEGG